MEATEFSDDSIFFHELVQVSWIGASFAKPCTTTVCDGAIAEEAEEQEGESGGFGCGEANWLSSLIPEEELGVLLRRQLRFFNRSSTGLARAILSLSCSFSLPRSQAVAFSLIAMLWLGVSQLARVTEWLADYAMRSDPPPLTPPRQAGCGGKWLSKRQTPEVKSSGLKVTGNRCAV